MQVYFILKCSRCHWWRKTNGTTDELKDLREFKPCANCHGPRKFKCPNCANIVKMMRHSTPDTPPPEDNKEPDAAV